MSETVFILAIVFLTFVAPVWIVVHYVTQSRRRRESAAERERILQALWERAEGMEQRITVLESILDAEAPQWRDRL